jgi:hypothetical protein
MADHGSGPRPSGSPGQDRNKVRRAIGNPEILPCSSTASTTILEPSPALIQDSCVCGKATCSSVPWIMSRASSDFYQIPLRSLGRGRRQPVRQHSSSNLFDGPRRPSFGESFSQEDNRLSTDEFPLIPKEEVCSLSVRILI